MLRALFLVAFLGFFFYSLMQGVLPSSWEVAALFLAASAYSEKLPPSGY